MNEFVDMHVHSKFQFVGVTHGQANYNLIHADVSGWQDQHWLYRRAGR